MICDRKSFMLNTTYDNTVFLPEWSIYGIICLTGLFLLTPLTHLKRDWINSGTNKILFTISEHSYREPEVDGKFCMNNFTKLVYCKVFLWCGHRGFKLCLRLRLRHGCWHFVMPNKYYLGFLKSSGCENLGLAVWRFLASDLAWHLIFEPVITYRVSAVF